MKTLNETFTDKEFAELRRAKHKFLDMNTGSWRTYLLKVAREINKNGI